MTFGLFQAGPLQQDSGDLSERWGQDGSVLVNVAGGSASATIYTVTAGKTLYVKTIFMSSQSSGVTLAYLRDGGSGGTIKFAHTFKNQYTGLPGTIEVPLAFTTDVYLDGSGDEFGYTLIGWEE